MLTNVMLWPPSALRAANHRYLEFISTLADPSAGVERLRKLSQTVIEHERSYRGFNLFCEEDQQLMQFWLEASSISVACKPNLT